MTYNFQRLIETVSPAFLIKEKLDTWEMLDWLNRTQDRFIRLKYLNQNSFEENVYRLSQVVDDLAKLVKVSKLMVTMPVDNIDNAIRLRVPSDFIAYIRSDSVIDRTLPNSISNGKVGNIEINYDKIDSLITTPYNSPILEAPVVTMADESPTILIIADKYTTLKEFYLTYLKQPEKITLDSECELANYMHEDLVKLAVSMFLDEYKLKLAGGKQNA